MSDTLIDSLRSAEGGGLLRPQGASVPSLPVDGLADHLRRRADHCAGLAANQLQSLDRSRLEGKGAAYRHAAALVARQCLAGDVQELVRAAREVAFGEPTPEAIKRLDSASEAFADRVPWDDDPDESALGAGARQTQETGDE